jgi:hypothetical protein
MSDYTDAQRWQWLASLKCNSFSLGRDENHACNYMTAKQWIEETCHEDFQDVAPDELQRMKDTNTIWALQIYPHTPVGFNVWYGATAESVVDAAMRDYGVEPAAAVLAR